MVPGKPLVQKITPNSFLTVIPPSLTTADRTTGTHSSSSHTEDGTSPTILFFIPGNPGLIAYYHLFLVLLARELERDSHYRHEEDCSVSGRNSGSGSGSDHGFVIFGRSMGGFELRDGELRSALLTRTTSVEAGQQEKPEEEEKGEKATAEAATGATAAAAAGGDDDGESDEVARLYGLEQQIEFVERQLEKCVRRWRTSSTASKRTKVILVGHSVGAYVAMEILRRRRETEKGAMAEDGDYAPMEIIGGVMLFPTIVDIAKSSAGKRLTLLLNVIPYLDIVTGVIARTLTSVLPDSVLRQVVATVMRHPREDAINTTMAFLKSKCGVRQAIHMAADEMRNITVDKWNDEVWGIAAPEMPFDRQNGPPAQLVFYFGRNDHWVAEQTRDDIIKARGSKVNTQGGAGPKMVLCEDNVVHGFCIGHSDIMARKVAGFVRDILMEQRKKR
ncbi:hypothetical protein VTO42DRAFT_2116 [Malbranchea cinnamomea]